jgi:hypothetical protein
VRFPAGLTREHCGGNGGARSGKTSSASPRPGEPCSTVRTPTGRVVPGKPPFHNSITGTALTVLHTVIYSWSST